MDTWIAEMLVEKYGERRDPNRYALQAPIDIYDAAVAIKGLLADNRRLVFELENCRDVRESGVQDEG